MDRTKFCKPSELQSSNFISDKCTFLRQWRELKLNRNRLGKQWRRASFSFRGCAGMAALAETPDVDVYILMTGALYLIQLRCGNISWISKRNLGKSYWVLMFCLRKISRVCLCSERGWKPEISKLLEGKMLGKNKQTNKYVLCLLDFNSIYWSD